MLQFNGNKVQISNIKRRFKETVDVVGRRPRIGMLVKGIGILALDFWQSRVIDIKRHGLLLPENIWTKVIETADMVLMFVRDENGIKFYDVLAQHLLAEIGAGIHSHCHFIGLNQNGGAEPFIARVLGPAHGTSAADDWHTL